ncbi:hypothetical protein [Dactylosporangium darangshiense]|uniref:Right handed beta helix domain-containing protein n=1 Tax=Dactylosporangium darangshiense TaxID=579108 RepID=A0ABP8D5Y2_9ACTN
MLSALRIATAAAACGVLVVGVAGCKDDGRPSAGGSTQPSTSAAASVDPSNSPAGSPSASASASASATRKPTSAPPTGGGGGGGSTGGPRTNGKPDASSTGVRPGTQLTVVNGDQTFSTDNQVISGKDFHGFVKVTGKNIRFVNCVFRGRATSSNNALLDTDRGTGTVVEDSEFVPSNPSATLDGVYANNLSIYRANIHGSVDGVKTGSNVLVQDSYIHDMSWFASDPNQGGGATHNDGVQGFLGDSNVVLKHNNIDMSTTHDGNAAFQDSAKNARVEDNWLDGGGCTLNFNHVNAPLGGIVVINNRFGRHSSFKCPILLSTQTTLTTNSGNVWADTGQPIPAPQRHD